MTFRCLGKTELPYMYVACLCLAMDLRTCSNDIARYDVHVISVDAQTIIIILYSRCCRSACAIDHAPTDAGGACKISSQRTRATRGCTILITI